MSYQPAIASMSLGRAWVHDLENKLVQASKAGFKGVEIFYEDSEYFTRSLFDTDANAEHSPTQLVEGADQVRALCEKQNLQIIGLQPCMFYEGLLNRKQHDKLIEKLHVWFQIADALRIDLIQIPSKFLPASQLTGDVELIVADLVEVADLGRTRDRPIRFAYENLCWGTLIDTWENAWEIVRRVDRPNFDPESPDSKKQDADARLHESLDRLVNTVDVTKVFYIQLVDAEQLDSPLDKNHPYYVEGQPAPMSWSRNARCFMYETARGAYLPVEEVTRAIIRKVGYRGFVSMELFSRTMSDPDPQVPYTHAQRGIQSWAKIFEHLGLDK